MDYFKNDFLFLGMKFVTKSILGPKWELTQNVGTKWVLISDLRFSWFSCFYQFQVLKWQSQKSFANIRGHFVGFWLYFADHFLNS